MHTYIVYLIIYLYKHIYSRTQHERSRIWMQKNAKTQSNRLKSSRNAKSFSLICFTTFRYKLCKIYRYKYSKYLNIYCLKGGDGGAFFLLFCYFMLLFLLDDKTFIKYACGLFEIATIRRRLCEREMGGSGRGNWFTVNTIFLILTSFSSFS